MVSILDIRFFVLLCLRLELLLKTDSGYPKDTWVYYYSYTVCLLV